MTDTRTTRKPAATGYVVAIIDGKPTRLKLAPPEIAARDRRILAERYARIRRRLKSSGLY